jgi:hypothetical protein
VVGKGAVGLHLFAQRFRQIDIETDDLVAGIQRFKRRIGGGNAEIDFICGGCASGEGGSNAARTNFFIVMLPSVLFMRRVCGMDVQCQLMNLYAIKMIKYFLS